LLKRHYQLKTDFWTSMPQIPYSWAFMAEMVTKQRLPLFIGSK
jgi:hypothetical protein